MNKTKNKTFQFIVVTGGPGAGKTALLELVKKRICPHVAILPEAASIIFSGGFWRLPSITAKIAAQKSIFFVQKEMEDLVVQERSWTVAFCDRGSLDTLAYWPKSEENFWQTLETTQQKEFSKYHAVLHLRSPSADLGYNHQNPIRTESAQQAADIDQSIAKIWQSHPNYYEVKSDADFLIKVQAALAILQKFMPTCCSSSLKDRDKLSHK